MAELDLFRHALSAEQSTAGTRREAVHHDVERWQTAAAEHSFCALTFGDVGVILTATLAACWGHDLYTLLPRRDKQYGRLLMQLDVLSSHLYLDSSNPN